MAVRAWPLFFFRLEDFNFSAIDESIIFVYPLPTSGTASMFGNSLFVHLVFTGGWAEPKW